MDLEKQCELIEKIKRIAFVQIFCSFDATRLTSVNAAEDIMQGYIEEIGRLSLGNAEYTGRSRINILDVLQALQKVGDELRSIIRYADVVDNKPFALPLPKHFTIRRRPKVQVSFSKVSEHVHSSIPQYFPAFPDKHTYSNSSDLSSKSLKENKNTNIEKHGILSQGESDSFRRNVINKIGQKFKKQKRTDDGKQELRKLNTFMDHYNVKFDIFEFDERRTKFSFGEVSVFDITH